MVEILTKTNEIALGLNGALIFSNSIEFEYWKTSEVDYVAFCFFQVKYIVTVPNPKSTNREIGSN